MSEFRNSYRKQFCNLLRRIKLLALVFEETKEGIEVIGQEAAAATLGKLRNAVDSAKELLQFRSEGSKICLILDRTIYPASFAFSILLLKINLSCRRVKTTGKKETRRRKSFKKIIVFNCSYLMHFFLKALFKMKEFQRSDSCI